jgi:hypothetical protein
MEDREGDFFTRVRLKLVVVEAQPHSREVKVANEDHGEVIVDGRGEGPKTGTIVEDC